MKFLILIITAAALSSPTFAGIYLCEANETGGYDLKTITAISADGIPLKTLTIMGDVTKTYCSQLLAANLKSCQ